MVFIKKIVFIVATVCVMLTRLHAQEYDFVVAQDGSGDFTTVQEALMTVPDFRKNVTTIYIKNGVYQEKLILPASKTSVRLIGEDIKKTVLTHDDFATKKNSFGEEMGTTGSTSFYIFGVILVLKISLLKIQPGRLGRPSPCGSMGIG